MTLKLKCNCCGWEGDESTAEHLTINKLEQLGMVDKHGFLLPRYEKWSGSICPICHKTKLEEIIKLEEVKEIVEDQLHMDRIHFALQEAETMLIEKTIDTLIGNSSKRSTTVWKESTILNWFNTIMKQLK